MHFDIENVDLVRTDGWDDESFVVWIVCKLTYITDETNAKVRRGGSYGFANGEQNEEQKKDAAGIGSHLGQSFIMRP